MAKGQKRTTKEPLRVKDEGHKAKKDAGPKYLRGSAITVPGDLHSRGLGGVKKK